MCVYIICVIYSQFCPVAPRGFCQFLRGGARLAFCRAGQPIFQRGGAGWGGASIPDVYAVEPIW